MYLFIQNNLYTERRALQDTPLLNWIPDVDVFLKEFLRLEGRGDFAQQDTCLFCSEDAAAEYRCQDCFGGAMYCKKCTLLLHSRNPLHRIKVSCIAPEHHPLLLMCFLRSGMEYSLIVSL